MAANQTRLTDFFHARRKCSFSPDLKRRRINGKSRNSSPDQLSWKQKAKNSHFAINADEANKPPGTPYFTEDVNHGALEIVSPLQKRKLSAPVTDNVAPDSRLDGALLPQAPVTAKRKLKFTQLHPENNQIFEKKSLIDPVKLPEKPELSNCTKKANDLLPESKAVEVWELPPASKIKISDVRKKLGRVRNLDELRAKLASFSEVAAKLNEQKRQGLEDTKANLEALSPLKSHENRAITPKKSPYAYEKFSRLAEKSSPCQLELPAHYRLLFEMFRSTETLVSLMDSRDELITYPKLKSAVQQMLKKNFGKRHLSQIKTVYPEAYSYRLVKLAEKFGQRSRPDQFDLVVSPNLETDLVNYNASTPQKTPTKSPCNSLVFGLSPRKVSPVSPIKTPEKIPQEKKKLTVARQVVRREIFKSSLLQIVKKHHREFLKSLSPPVELSIEEESQIQRWNPSFEARISTVPDVQPSELPHPPSEQKPCIAKELLQRTGESLPAIAQQGLVKAASRHTNSKTSAGNKQANLKGVPNSLLERIRAKQALNEKMALLQSPCESLRKLRLSRLPDIVRILRNVFLTERKNSLPVNDVMKKLSDSYGQLSADELDQHLVLLAEVLPKWISRAEIANQGIYLKIKKETKISDLISTLEKVQR